MRGQAPLQGSAVDQVVHHREREAFREPLPHSERKLRVARRRGCFQVQLPGVHVLRIDGGFRWTPPTQRLGSTEVARPENGESTCGEFDEMCQSPQGGNAAQELADLVGERNLRVGGGSSPQQRGLHEPRIVRFDRSPLQRREDAR
ncbi:hypothetical protein C6W96_31380 [Streptomyces sp. CS149]|nr:hypothetical protein C6W96_31380 [Streptomyces sp. CS149]